MLRFSDDTKNETTNPSFFTCLNGKDVIQAGISDHHPIIHNGVLFWNIMMKGKTRNHNGITSYNNGFGIVESENQYLSRLMKVAHVIAEITFRNPAINTIGLCEGPVEAMHVNIFLSALKKFRCMHRFINKNGFHKPNDPNHANWGLLMLTEGNDHVCAIECKTSSKLANRFQLWRLTRNNQDRYFALAHFPFGGDEYVSEKDSLSDAANGYCGLINDILNKYNNDDLVFCADFNFNPYLINHFNDRALDQITHNNSILITALDQSIQPVTVDGILLSRKLKQQLHHLLQPSMRIYNKLKHEYHFFKTYIETALEENPVARINFASQILSGVIIPHSTLQKL